MAIDWLRNEVADLALLDDLTGAANGIVAALIEERRGRNAAVVVRSADRSRRLQAINDTRLLRATSACST
jgi:hypothetical protein